MTDTMTKKGNFYRNCSRLSSVLTHQRKREKRTAQVLIAGFVQNRSRPPLSSLSSSSPSSELKNYALKIWGKLFSLSSAPTDPAHTKMKFSRDFGRRILRVPKLGLNENILHIGVMSSSRKYPTKFYVIYIDN